MKTVQVNPFYFADMEVKTESASALSLIESERLAGWCRIHSRHLWEDLNLQQILNVYRACANGAWSSFEAWYHADSDEAMIAWNDAINPDA